MKKTVLAAAIALALTTGAGAPAYAAETRQQSQQVDTSVEESFTTNPIRLLIALLLPAVQKVH